MPLECPFLAHECTYGVMTYCIYALNNFVDERENIMWFFDTVHRGPQHTEGSNPNRRNRRRIKSRFKMLCHFCLWHTANLQQQCKFDVKTNTCFMFDILLQPHSQSPRWQQFEWQVLRKPRIWHLKPEFISVKNECEHKLHLPEIVHAFTKIPCTVDCDLMVDLNF